MADVDLQALLDPDGMNTGLRIVRRYDFGTSSSYFIQANGPGWAGHARWINCVDTDTDAVKNTAIRAAML